MLSTFLPTGGAAAGVWLSHVFDLWLGRGVHGSSEYDALWLNLLARLAKEEFHGHAEASGLL